MADFRPGDILLDGKPYRVDFDSWRSKDVIDFAPRATVPGGSAVLSDLGMFQPLYQTDWRHGFGFHWYSDAMGFMRTEGNVDTRHSGLAMLFTEAQDGGDVDQEHKFGGTIYFGEFYSYGLSGLKKYNAGTHSWTTIYPNPVLHALSAGSVLFFVPLGDRIQFYDGASVSPTGLNSDAREYSWLIMHNGYIYAGKGQAIHFDNSPTLGTLQGNEQDPNRIRIGPWREETRGAIVYNGNLYVRRRDGIWHIGEDRIARRMLDFSAELSDDNLKSWAVINGYLVFAVRDRVLQWNGARVSDITPHKITDTWPYINYGSFNNFVAVGDYLYCTARTNEDAYSEDLLAFDGVGWHKLARLIDGEETGGAGEITMLTYDGVNNRLWYYSTYFGKTKYFQFQQGSSFPYANFPITGTHSLITSRIDVGFRRVKKSMDRMYIEAGNCAEDHYIKVYFSLDGGEWVHWDDIKNSGVMELKSPGGDPTQEWNWMQLRFDFVTSDPAETPILEGFSLSFIMRPETRKAYSFNVHATSGYRHGMYKDDRTAQEILDDLYAVRNSATPVELVDIFGRTHLGYLTSIQEQPVYRVIKDDDSTVDIETVFLCNFVEI